MPFPIDMRVLWDAPEEAHSAAVVMEVHFTVKAMEFS